ncbi:MAG TPA: hypothetical protein VGH79_03835 [Gaiellaceae bacterium]|jgi:hypothetical protein
MSTNWSEELRPLDAVGPTRDLWEDALVRAGSAAPSRAWRRRTVVALAVLAFAGIASAFAYRLLSPSPGFTAGLSGLESLPTVPWPASMPEGSLPMLASGIGLTPSEAKQRLRLVQSGLSFGTEGDLSLYAFPGEDGSACVFVAPGVGGICLPTWNVQNPAFEGIAWAAWPGDGPPSSSGPLVVFGLVADSVRSVEADVGGTTRSVPIVDNSFFAGYDSIPDTASIKLVITYDDGTTRTQHQSNPYADNGPTTILPPHGPAG